MSIALNGNSFCCIIQFRKNQIYPYNFNMPNYLYKVIADVMLCLENIFRIQ